MNSTHLSVEYEYTASAAVSAVQLREELAVPWLDLAVSWLHLSLQFMHFRNSTQHNNTDTPVTDVNATVTDSNVTDVIHTYALHVELYVAAEERTIEFTVPLFASNEHNELNDLNEYNAWNDSLFAERVLNGSIGKGFYGCIEEIRIWNTSELLPWQRNHWRFTPQLDPQTEQLLVSWPLDECTGEVAHDTVSNHTLSIFGNQLCSSSHVPSTARIHPCSSSLLLTLCSVL